MIRVLALCDSPTSATGFAQVSKNILQGLAKTGKYQIDVIGINYYGDYYDREKHPYNIYPAMPQGWRDMYGRDRLLSALSGKQKGQGLEGPWDIIFTIQDHFIMEGMGLGYPFAEQLLVTSEMWKRIVPSDQWYKWIGYWPVDATLKENWVTRSIAMCNYPVAYCEYGKQEILKHDRGNLKVNFNLTLKENGDRKAGEIPVLPLRNRIKVIPHGIDTSVFHPLPDEEIKQFRKDYFKGAVKEDTYLVINVSRNQPRKDIPRTIKAFAEFRKKVPNTHLYLHMQGDDAGGSIREYCRFFGLSEGIDYSLPADFSSGNGVSVETVNKIYNAADLCITTTLGEGWGFILSEAMATKTPIIAPNNTSVQDIFNSYNYTPNVDHISMMEDPNDLRGIPVKCGTTSSEWISLGLEDNERIRPLTNVDDLVSKMIWVKKNPNIVNEIVARGYEWVTKLTWNNIVAQWDEIFTNAYSDLQNERELTDKFDKVGRNDLCPCGSGKKFKACHYNQEYGDKLGNLLKA